MKKLLFLIFTSFSIFTFLHAQEFADFEFTGTNKGSGIFTKSALSNFTWEAVGTIYGSLQILNNEEFNDGNQFENIFGQANNAENIRMQIYPNGPGTDGTPILSKARLTFNFDQITPIEKWGFCVVDIDVEHCLISAIDEFDNEVNVEKINEWLFELFDTDTIDDGLNIPKWDSTNAALLGADTEEDYVVYDSLVIGGLPSSEAAAAFFMPDIPLKSLIIDFENLQQTHLTSFHFYIASLPSDDATLYSIQINGEELPDFNSTTLNYNLELPIGTTIVPTLFATSTDSAASVEITQAPELPGTASILITAEDDETQQTYSITFTVTPNNDASLSSIFISNQIIEGFNTDTLDYAVEQSTGTTPIPTITATLTDTNATIEITQTLQLPGTATILITAEDGITQKTYTIEFTIPTSILDMNLINEIMLFPNPTENKLKIQGLKFKFENTSIEIYNLNGRKLLEQEISAGVETAEIDVSNLQSGVYYCKISGNNKQVVKKWIKH